VRRISLGDNSPPPRGGRWVPDRRFLRRLERLHQLLLDTIDACLANVSYLVTPDRLTNAQVHHVDRAMDVDNCIMWM
jgi:hypothetical protein